MKTKICRKTTMLPSLVLSLFAFTEVHAQAEAGVNEWQYTLTPYLWLPRIEGTMNYSLPPGDGGNPSFGVGPTDWLDLLNFGLLVSGSARKDDFVILSDFIYLSMSTTDSSVTSVGDTISGPGAPVQLPIDPSLIVGTKAELDGLAWMIAAGYRIEDTSSSTMDAFAGLRYFGVDTTARWTLSSDITAPGGGILLPAEGGVSRDTDLWDGIIGVRGQFDMTSEKLSVPYYFDIGLGQSDLTWQAAAGLSWAFGWGELLVMYRHLDYDEGSSGLLKNFSFGGPLIGAKFSF